jgi:hypothetical protein
MIQNSDNPPQPAAPAANKPAAPPTVNTAANAAVTAQVYNAAGTPGLAGQVLGMLTSQGFTSGGTGNGTIRSTTVIDYASGDQSAAQKVSSALGGNVTMVTSTVVSPGTVRVYLGTDYAGPKSGGTPPKASTSTGSTSSAPPPITAGAANCIN